MRQIEFVWVARTIFFLGIGALGASYYKLKVLLGDPLFFVIGMAYLGLLVLLKNKLQRWWESKAD